MVLNVCTASRGAHVYCSCMEFMHNHSEMLFGTIRQLLFGTDGGIQGVLLTVKGRTVQVSMSPAEGAALADQLGAGKRMRILAIAALPPVGTASAHPLYTFFALSDTGGDPLPLPYTAPGESLITGQVSALHFAPEGEPNGVILDTGELIHVGTAGMAATGLRVGTKIRAIGELGRTSVGGRMLRANQVNGVAL